MIRPDKIEQLAKQLVDALPQSLQKASQDLQASFHEILRSGLAKLDLVTREEFDIQTGVLLKTRQELKRLEEKLRQLEENINK